MERPEAPADKRDTHDDDGPHPRLDARFSQALVFAVTAHRDQTRKGGRVPYVGHLLEVCGMVINDGGTEDEAIGALLHDAVEDQGGEEMLTTIRARFGERVAEIVVACSDATEHPKPPWRERKEAHIRHLQHADRGVLRVCTADKLSNARAILRDHRRLGADLWQRFKAGPADQLWYYETLTELFLRRAPGPMADELREVVHTLRHEVGAG